MKLFSKKEETCCCGGNCEQSTMEKAESKKQEAGIKILGSGCKKCNELEANVVAALQSLGKHQEVEHISDFAQIASYGVMSTPALVVDGKVVSYGKVISVEEAKVLLSNIG